MYLPFFLQIKLHIMRRILSTTFISCSHGEIRFLQSKKQESKTTEESILGIESHRFQNQESDSIPKISESYSPSEYKPGSTAEALALRLSSRDQ